MSNYKPNLTFKGRFLDLTKEQKMAKFEIVRKYREKQTYKLWMEIQDLIGKASLWPKSMRKLFWTPHLDHFHRILIAVFGYINGLHPDILLQWAKHMKLCRDVAAERHIENLYCIFKREGKQYGKLYAFNVTNLRYEYIDGTVRHYEPKHLRESR